VTDLHVPGAKDDEKKLRWSLLPIDAVRQVVEVQEYGAQKYTADGWRSVPEANRRYYDAAQRHLVAWWLGEEKDPESGLSHLAHAACNVLFLLALKAKSPMSELLR